MQNSIILIDKPEGITSYDVIRKLKKQLNIKKIGHAGVLDKPASGLLVCATGRATKILSLFEDGYKIYTTKIQLGIKTDTYDITGNIVEQKEKIQIDEGNIQPVLNEFMGKIIQTAPVYSNIKIKGKKLYRYALGDEEIDLPKREIIVYGIELLNFDGKFLNIMVKCSKGTYIRSLANDIGNRLGVYGCVYSLRRIFSYPFSVESASDLNSPKQLSMNDALNFLPSIRVDDGIIKKIQNGVVFSRLFDSSSIENGLYRILDKNNNLISIIEKQDKKISYRFIEIN